MTDLTFLDRLSAARRASLQAMQSLREADRVLENCRALAEWDAIEAAGGEKEFGPNAEARARNMTIALDDSANVGNATYYYRDQRRKHEAIRQQAEIAALDVAILLDEFRYRELAVKETTLAIGGKP